MVYKTHNGRHTHTHAPGRDKPETPTVVARNYEFFDRRSTSSCGWVNVHRRSTLAKAFIVNTRKSGNQRFPALPRLVVDIIRLRGPRKRTAPTTACDGTRVASAVPEPCRRVAAQAVHATKRPAGMVLSRGWGGGGCLRLCRLLYRRPNAAALCVGAVRIRRAPRFWAAAAGYSGVCEPGRGCGVGSRLPHVCH